MCCCVVVLLLLLVCFLCCSCSCLCRVFLFLLVFFFLLLWDLVMFLLMCSTDVTAGMIPVVDGVRAHYETHLPPHSYINCADFTTTKECTDHILAVSRDYDLFTSYHEWKQHSTIERRDNHYDNFCRQVLHNNKKENPPINAARFRDKTHCRLYRE